MLTAVHSCSWERADKVFPDINFQIDTSDTHPEEIARRLLAQTFKGECLGLLAMYCQCECYSFLYCSLLIHLEFHRKLLFPYISNLTLLS